MLAVASVGCHRESWRVNDRSRVGDADLAAALGDTDTDNSSGLRASDVPAIAYPRSLRPCCAFGADLKVALGSVPVPGVELGNLTDPSRIGTHRFDNGAISLQSDDPRGLVGDENNGLVYTCRGGFIDLAHVRDNADNTLALASAIARQLEIGGGVEVPPQGASMRVVLRPVGAEVIERYGRIRLAVVLAQWIAYQFSIWHEIATFYGYASISQWPEKISAFSPEDLYSNQLGVRIAGGVILGKQARSDLEYGVGMDAWLRRTLERLKVVSLEDSHEAMRRLDGRWWDSSKRIPDWALVRRRQFDTGPYLRPWRLEDASQASSGEVKPLAACSGAAPELTFHVVDGFAGAMFQDYATVEFDVDDALVAAGFPLPDTSSRRVTQRDFPAVIETIRRTNADTFGEGADTP